VPSGSLRGRPTLGIVVRARLWSSLLVHSSYVPDGGYEELQLPRRCHRYGREIGMVYALSSLCLFYGATLAWAAAKHPLMG
jgi:hypothetical protein